MDEEPGPPATNDAPLPDVSALSPGALALLALAAGAFDDRNRERRHDLVEGAAFRYCWSLCEELPQQCAEVRDGRIVELLTWMDAEHPPPNLFMLCGWLADGIHKRICGRHSSLRPSRSDRTTGFDHAVYLALGQTLSHFFGMEGGLGPDFAEIIGGLAKLEAEQLQNLFLRNYIGNVLQDYFDQSAVRLTHRNLPPETERDLRRIDAVIVADLVFSDASHSEGPLPWSKLNRSLKRVIGAVTLAESALDD